MINLSATLVPNIGWGEIKLYAEYAQVKSELKACKIQFTERAIASLDEIPPNPWKVIAIKGVAELFFASNNKLFKIVAYENFKGSLPNGITIGLPLKEAQRIDETLSFDEWDEIYVSKQGYSLEDSTETGKVISIEIAIPELENEDFDKCEW